MPLVVFSQLARADLKKIGDYIATESFSRSVARRFVDSVKYRCRTYAGQPMSAEARPELGEDIRCFPVGNYIVFYRPRKHGIDVLRVLHGRRELRGLSDVD